MSCQSQARKKKDGLYELDQHHAYNKTKIMRIELETNPRCFATLEKTKKLRRRVYELGQHHAYIKTKIMLVKLETNPRCFATIEKSKKLSLNFKWEP